MSEVELSELYQEVILDHNKRPRNFGRPEGANRYSHGVNPVCGDNYHLYLQVGEDGVIQKIGFEGAGCAISKSSASMMTEAVKGLPAAEAGVLKDRFLKLLTTDASEEVRRGVGRLKLFEGVKNFPIRVKCATLIWRALEDALAGPAGGHTDVSTEEP